MSSKMEEILTIVSLHSVDVLDEEAALDSISHIIGPKPKKAAKAIWDESGFTLKGGDGKTIVKIGRIGEHDLEPVGLAKQDLYSGSILKPSSDELFPGSTFTIVGDIPKYGVTGGVCPKCYMRRELCLCSTAKHNIDPHFGVAFDPVTGIEVKKEVGVKTSSEKIARPVRGNLPIEKNKPSTLEVIPYEYPEYKHLPEHAREMIEMIEAEEFRIFSEFSESQADWHRIVKYKVDGSEEIQWLHKSEFDNTEAEEYEKFLSDSIAEVKNEKNEERVSIEGRDKVIVLKDMFNLHVSGVDS